MRSLLSQITDHFPYIARPDDSDLTVHGGSCIFCEGLITDLEPHRGDRISQSDARVLLNELSSLSPDGLLWVLPSYLHAILSEEPDEELAEFFVYFFSVETPEKEIDEYNAKVARFSVSNLDYLERVLEYIGSYLGEVYADDIDKGTAEIRRLKLTKA